MSPTKSSQAKINGNISIPELSSVDTVNRRFGIMSKNRNWETQRLIDTENNKRKFMNTMFDQAWPEAMSMNSNQSFKVPIKNLEGSILSKIYNKLTYSKKEQGILKSEVAHIPSSNRESLNYDLKYDQKTRTKPAMCDF